MAHAIGESNPALPKTALSVVRHAASGANYGCFFRRWLANPWLTGSSFTSMVSSVVWREDVERVEYAAISTQAGLLNAER